MVVAGAGVRDVLVEPGQQVDTGAVLIVIDEASGIPGNIPVQVVPGVEAEDEFVVALATAQRFRFVDYFAHILNHARAGAGQLHQEGLTLWRRRPMFRPLFHREFDRHHLAGSDMLEARVTSHPIRSC